MKIELYTDGSAVMPRKPGGYAWIMLVDGVKHSEACGRIQRADNNDAELEAALRGITHVYQFVANENKMGLAEVSLHCDSQIVLSWAGGTYEFKNPNKYQRFLELKNYVQLLRVKMQWVRGHSGNEHNERCDQMARQGRLNQIHESILTKSTRGAEKSI